MTFDARRARIFGEVAELYDEYRPSYPDEMVDDVLAAVGIGTPTAVDVGCGTGKAVMCFARRGCRVTGIEPDPAMAALAARNLSSFAGCSVVSGSFESWDGGGSIFDLLTCGQAWHWLNPEVRGRHAHELLRTGGVVALFWNMARRDECGLRPELDAAYGQHAPDLQRTSVLLGYGGGGTGDMRVIIPDDGTFELLGRTTYDWTVRYTTEEYVGLMQTHSDHRILGADALARLVDAVSSVVDAAGGTIDYAYRTTLVMARAV